MSIFTTYIYQPFFNILVGIYWALGYFTETPDMGIAVIIFAIIVRIIMLPLNLAGDRSAEEKLELSQKVKSLRKELKHDPIELKKQQRKLLMSNPVAIASESLTLFIQLIIILMLYRIFKTGLEGADLHLLYDFMPSIPQPINLVFLGIYDLSHPNLALNLIQSASIFILEAINLIFSTNTISRRDFISMIVILPIVSFFIFALLPAGKKLFIITTIWFSICLLLVKQILFWYHSLLVTSPKPASDQAKSEK